MTSTSSKIVHSFSGLSHPIPRLILSAVRGHVDAYADGGLQTALLMLRYLAEIICYMCSWMWHIPVDHSNKMIHFPSSSLL